MPTTTPKIFNSLFARISMPILALMILVAWSLYYFVLSAMEDYKDSEIVQTLNNHADAVYSIADNSYIKLVRSDALADPVQTQIVKAHTLGKIEDFLRQENIAGIIFTTGTSSEPLLSYNFNLPTDVLTQKPGEITSYAANARSGDEMYLKTLEFSPWNWSIVIKENSAKFSFLLNKVDNAYKASGIILFIATMTILLYLGRSLKIPINTIITPIKENRSPTYKGINEFEFLSDSIAQMMATIEEKNIWIAKIFQTVGALLLVLDDRGKIVMFNRRAEETTGFTEADVVGKYLWQTIISTDKASHCKQLFKKNIDGGNYSFENTILTKEGKFRSIFWNNTFIKGPAGKLNYFIWTGIDVTESKELENQLRQAQKMEAIGTLAGGIAHDFNNILAAILGFADLACDDISEDSPAYEDIQEVQKAGRRAKELIQQLLAFSRGADQSLKPLKVSLIVAEALNLLRASIPTSINIKTNITAEETMVLADPTQIHQVLVNLGSNAAHAMEANGGTLSVELKEENFIAEEMEDETLHPGLYLRLSVTDTGKGMSDEVRARMFDPFFTTKEVDKGSGLGLSVVHGIVKNHTGFIRVESEEEKGTAVHIFLPVCDSNATEVEIHDSNGAAPTGNERILLIDDESTILTMMKHMLGKLGYSVTLHNNSIEALKIFQHNPFAFDLVITDQTMPDLTGDKLASRMLAIRPNLPIILCSGFSASIDEQKAKDLGARTFLLKPISKEELAFAVRAALDA